MFQRIEEAIEKAIKQKFADLSGPVPTSLATQSVNLNKVPPAAGSVPVKKGDGHNSMASTLSDFGSEFPTLKKYCLLKTDFVEFSGIAPT